MEKTIIILDGVSYGKTDFGHIAKREGNYWTWNINHRNVLTVIAHKLFWDGNRNAKYYDFIEEVREIATRYWNFEEKYVASMIEKFERDDKTILLVIHSCSEDIKDKIQSTERNCYSIKISNTDDVDVTYCKTLNCKSETFKEDVLNTLAILTNNKDE